MRNSQDVRSIVVPIGYTATLYENEFFGGRTRVYNGDQNDVDGMKCITLPSDWYFRSITIESTKATTGIHSSWVQIGNGYGPVIVKGAFTNKENQQFWTDLEAGVIHHNGHTVDRVNYKFTDEIQTLVTSAERIPDEYIMAFTCQPKWDE